MSDTGEKYVSETQKLAETQHLAITQGLKRLFKDTQWTVEQLSFVVGHKSVSASVCHDLLSKFGISKEDRVNVIKNLGRTLLDELETLFRSLVLVPPSGCLKHRRSKVINSKPLNMRKRTCIV